MARNKKTTMAKLNRETKLAERRMAKEARKEARKSEPTPEEELHPVLPQDDEELAADIARVLAALD
jgi:hypothetical protein